MGCPPVRKIIHSLNLVDYLHLQADSNGIYITYLFIWLKVYSIVGHCFMFLLTNVISTKLQIPHLTNAISARIQIPQLTNAISARIQIPQLTNAISARIQIPQLTNAISARIQIPHLTNAISARIQIPQLTSIIVYQWYHQTDWEVSFMGHSLPMVPINWLVISHLLVTVYQWYQDTN